MLMTLPLSPTTATVLAEARVAMEENLAWLRLKMHPIKSQLFETRYRRKFCRLSDTAGSN